jgi:hypothetical protein
MSSDAERAEAELLVDSYGKTSALVRLAQVAAPACRIEPQLLRQLRLACVPDADVSVEQELWHSEFVSSRGRTITFHTLVARVLRERLRDWRLSDAELVKRARTVTSILHAGLSPLLVLEDELAWAEIFDENPAIRSKAQKLLDSLLAGRDGLNHWLGRAWAGLPAGLKALPEGRQLAQVAAAEGATIAPDPNPSVQQVVHALPPVALPLRLHGLRLDLNVPPAQATHVLDVPKTQPIAVSVRSASKEQQMVFGSSEARSVSVSPGIVVIRTLAGAEYELDAQTAAGELEIELLPAGRGTSLIIRYDSGTSSHQIIVDTGDRRAGALLAQRLKSEEQAPIELLVLTHIDDDRIGGALSVLQDSAIRTRLRDVWLNGSPQLRLGAPAV